MEPVWKSLRFAGHTLRYATAGHGPAVVLPKKDRHDYVPFRRLADRYTMLQVEPLGFGLSDRPEPYPRGGISAQVLAVCDAEGITDFAVWGFSQGGAMAFEVARATPRARLTVCGGFDVLRGLSRAWLARMNQEKRIPVASREFWNAFHARNWYTELQAMAIPKLTYFGTLDAQRVRSKDQRILRSLGVEVVEFPGLDHLECGFADPLSPATELVAKWLRRNGWRR